jgi:hypothetical protein
MREELRIQRAKNGLPQAPRETPARTAFDTREACEVKTYRDENRLVSKMLGERIVGGA